MSASLTNMSARAYVKQVSAAFGLDSDPNPRVKIDAHVDRLTEKIGPLNSMNCINKRVAHQLGDISKGFYCFMNGRSRNINIELIFCEELTNKHVFKLYPNDILCFQSQDGAFYELNSEGKCKNEITYEIGSPKDESDKTPTFYPEGDFMVLYNHNTNSCPTGRMMISIHDILLSLDIVGKAKYAHIEASPTISSNESKRMLNEFVKDLKNLLE